MYLNYFTFHPSPGAWKAIYWRTAQSCTSCSIDTNQIHTHAHDYLLGKEMSELYCKKTHKYFRGTCQYNKMARLLRSTVIYIVIQQFDAIELHTHVARQNWLLQRYMWTFCLLNPIYLQRKFFSCKWCHIARKSNFNHRRHSRDLIRNIKVTPSIILWKKMLLSEGISE